MFSRKEFKNEARYQVPFGDLFLFLYEHQYRIHMPRGLMDDLERGVAYEKVHEGGLGEDIFSADLNREDALLPNI